jgi:Spy/CpxP family protein refolding chaperone
VIKLWIALFATAVFAGGASVGVVADRKVLKQPQEPARDAGGWGGGPSYEMSVSRFADALDLTDDQNEALDLILGETKRDVEAYKRAIRVSSDRSREKVTALLTDEQKKKLEELMADERTKRHERELEKTMKFYATVLSLTEPQSTAVRAIVVEMKDKRRAYFAANTHGGDHTKMRAFMKGLHAEQAKRFEAVLTPEQQKKYAELGEWWD